jgi:membrane-associated phospholipid phosphatase
VGHLHRQHREAVVNVRAPLRWAALRSALALSVMFLVAYGLTNWFTSMRSDTRVWMYEWERFIPFVPVMIIPYLSIDAFFVVAPFLCTNRRELRTLSRRLALAIIIACLVFLAFPLRLGMERPPAQGVLGAVFEWFRALDHPHNLFPSLHITLRTILAATFARHSRGLWRWLLAIWFSLVGVSTLLTYQHHVIDIVGGFALAAVCFYAVPGKRARDRYPRKPHWRLAKRYALGAIVLAMLALLTLRFEGWILFWPATALALMSAAYMGWVRDVHRKRHGRIPLAARLILGPVLLGQWLSLLHYRRRSDPWNIVDDRVIIGSRLSEAQALHVRALGVTAVVDLTTEFSEARAFDGLARCNPQTLDLTAPTPADISRALAFIARNSPRGRTYVHCKAGYSRSAVIVGAYLISSGRCASAPHAMTVLESIRPRIVIRPEAADALLGFEMSHGRGAVHAR